MSSSKPSYGWSEISAAEQKKIPLPDRFLCRECKKFKSPPQYSNKQLNDYRFKVHTRQRVTNITAELRCRNCTGDQTQELQCTGPCALWKGLEDFSKNQRRRPENAWCVSCTQWKEANEPGITPAAPPNNLLSPDEEREVVETEAGFGAYATDHIEGEADSDDEDVGFIYTSMATTSIADDSVTGSNGLPGKASEVNAISTALPGYLTGLKKITNIHNTKSSLSNPYAVRSEYTGEGGKQRSEVTKSENNLPGNATKDRNHPHGCGIDWAAVEGKKQKAGVAYNAWDNVGQMHSQYRASSQTTALTRASGLPSRPDAQTISSGLVKQIPTTNRSSNTPNHEDARPVPSGQASGWAKQTLATRNPPPQFPVLSRPIKQNIYDDDDDSPDEI